MEVRTQFGSLLENIYNSTYTKLTKLDWSYVLRYGLLIGFSLLILWYITTAVLAWNRLKHIPAPSAFAHFSYWWLAKTTFSGKQYWVHRELHRKHGPLVRIGPNEVFTDDADIIKRISSARSTYNRGEWYTTGRFNPYHDNLFTVLPTQEHAKVKSRTAPSYSGRETPAIEPAIASQIERLVRVLRERYVKPANGVSAPLLDLGLISCYFTMDVITRLAFGQEFGYLEDETDHYSFLATVRSLWPQMSTSADTPWIRKILFSKIFLKLAGPRSGDKSGFGALMTVAERMVSQRFKEQDLLKQQDMLASFVRHGLNQQECEVEGLFMIVAGTESTASAIRSILVHIMTSPSVYSKLKQEIQQATRSEAASSPIRLEEAKRLPYLQAVIFEGLRVRTPLLGLFPKVVPHGGDTFHGKFIPAGTEICMNTSSLLRSQELFGPDADVYRPERFMELDKDARTSMERSVELAFGHGGHMCVGKPVAFMEMNKVVFELFRNFDFQLINPAKPSQILSYGVFIETSLFVKVSECSYAEARSATKSLSGQEKL